MIRPELEALLQGALDNTLTAEERAELARMLSESPEARERAAELSALAGLIESLGPADCAVGPRRPRSRAGFASPPCNSSRNFSTRCRREQEDPIRPGSSGSDRARRHHLQQQPARDCRDRSDHRRRPARAGAADRRQDVKLGDTSAQDVLQTETFDAIMKDETLRTMLQDAELRGHLADAAMRDALQDEGIRQALSDPALARKLDDENLKRALDDRGAAKKFDDANMRAMLPNQRFADALRSENFRNLLKKPGFAAALASATPAAAR